MTTEIFRPYIAGASTGPDENEMDLVDPSTGAGWGKAVLADPDTIDAAVASSLEASRTSTWSEREGTERGRALWRLADLIEANADQLARYEVLATGKNISVTQKEAGRAAAWYRYFGGWADKLDGRYLPYQPGHEATVRHEPLGVVAAITPFNGGLSLGTWKLAPALACGNTVVLKPPADAPCSSIMLAELAIKAGLPAGVLNVVPGGAEVGERLSEHHDIAAVTLTGSTAAGRRVGSLASGRLKKFMCEAGGKSAHIVFNDADLDTALSAAASGVFSNAGQSCVAGSRVLVQQDIYDRFVAELVERAKALHIGDPFDETNDLGPVASARQHERILGMVSRVAPNGGRIVTGGGVPPLPDRLKRGFYFTPTVITDVEPSAEIWCEEVFGPVMIVAPFTDEEDAVRQANCTEYGLAAGLWTRDIDRAHAVAGKLDAGTVWINTYRSMHYKVPFGGYKASGVGRENGYEALAEYLQTKAVVTAYR